MHIPSLTARRAVFAAAMLTAGGLVRAAGPAVTVTDVTGEVYHYQVTDHYCASASIQMLLDCTAVRSTNPYINTFLQAPDLPGVAHNVIPVQPTYVGGQVTAQPQTAIYNLIHGMATYTPVAGPFTGVPLSYYNPYTPWPVAGSGNNAIQYALNVLDNPNVGGNGAHAYTAYNLAPTFASGAYASRTMANAMKDYDVPAQATVGSGAHSIAVVGVSTIGTPGQNQAYTITGFFVNDPWTGYVINELASNRPAPGGGFGLGIHGWLRYGYQADPNAPLTFIPGVGNVRARPDQWFRNFNPAGGQAGEGAYMSGVGYKFVVEPQGPEALDTGGIDGTLLGFDGADPLLPSPIATPQDALARAISELGVETDLSDEPGLTGGGFDLSGIQFLPEADGYGGEWVVPYDQSSGMASGAVLIDALTGLIDEANWADNASQYFTDDQIDAMYLDLSLGILPSDNPVPEPGNAILAAPGIMLAMRRWRR